MTGREPIAVVGVGCRFPGAADTFEYWQLLAEARDAVREAPRHRFDPAAFYDPDPGKPGKSMSKWGGYLDTVDEFDWRAFRISPREAKFMDPQHRLLLEVAWEAFEDAGLPFEGLAGSRTSVFVGIMWPDYAKLASRDYTKLEGYNANGNSFAYSANRISYYFDLKGPSVALDVQCASSLTAVHLACQSLWSGDADVALAAGVNLIISPDTNIAMSKASILSPEGKCKTWDAAADGFVRGEGAGVAVLKPLSQAVADGDRVYAVIRSTVAHHGGKTDWIMAPSREGQERMLREAYEQAGIDPATVDYVELHGTGTKVGDPIEAAALAAVMAEGREPGSVCRVGSVKTNIGHLDSASGMAGLIKTAMALHRRQIPASLHFHTPNPALPLDHLQVVAELEPWPETDHEPVAGVSGLSFGGGHSHIVLTAGPAAAPQNERPPARPYLLPLSAKSDDALRLLARSFADFLRRDRVDLFDVCHTAAVRRTHHDVRAAVVARTREELIERLEALAADEPRPGVHAGKREGEPPRPVFVFSGQGTPWWATGRELLALEPVFRREVAACDQRMRPHARWSLLDELTRPIEASRLARTAVAQPATFALQMGLAALWRSWGVEPAAVIGHSIGEVAAVTAAGGIEPADAARLAVFRGKLMSDAPTHPAMAAVLLPMAETEALIHDFGPKVAVVADNAPSATLVSGDETSIAKLLARCEQQGVYATAIPEHDVFHRAPKAYGDALVDWLGELPTAEPAAPIFFTAVAERFDAAYWGTQMASRVEFRAAVEAAVAEGFTTFVELGAHPVLTGPVTECLRGQEVEGQVLPSLRRGEAEQATMLESAAQLFVRGHALRWANVLPGAGRTVSLPTHPWIRERLWIDVGDLSALPAAGAATASGHPLLGAHLRVAVSGQHVWESVVDRAVLRWLDDHLVGGVAVLAGASYVEMVTSAVEQAFGWSGCVLRDIDLGKALVLPENAPRRVQLVIAPADAETLSFQVLSRPSEASDGEPWTLHVKGTVAPLPDDADVAPVDLDDVRRPLHEEVSGAACYRRFEDQGEHYGPTFQGIAKLWRRDGEVLAQMRAPTPIVSDVPRFRFHPALLDACMHALVMAESEEEGGSGFMPTRIDEVVVTGRLDADAWSHVRLAERDELPTGTIDADITVLDKAGAPTMRIRGLHLQFLDESALKAPLSERWYYEVEWEPFERTAGGDAGRGEGTWVIVGEPTGVADALADRLRADGADVLVLAGRSSPIGDVLPARTAGVVHLGALASTGIGDMTVAELDELQTTMFGPALAAVRAGTKLVLVTRGTQCGHADAAPASLWGFGRSLAQERPELWGGLVDLDPALADDPEAAAEALHAHLVASDGEDQVAIRDGQWLAARLVRTRVAPTATKAHWRLDAAYLITGGLGDLGLGVARWLAEHGARRLVLMGRTPLPPRSEWRDLDPDSATAARTEAVRAIEALGVSVHVAACDVGDEASMRAFLDEYAAEGWPPIRGVIHSAGVAPFEAVEQMTLEGLHGVLRSKVAGSLVLHKVLPDLETFVLFSSASAVLSSPRLAHYAAGNAFEDGFAHFRHTLGLPALSVDWGPWAEVGMATRTGSGGPAALRGMHLIPLEEGFDAMDRLLVSGRPNVAVLPVEWDEWRESYRAMAAAPILRHVIGEGEPAAGAGAGAAGAEQTTAPASTSLLLLPPEERAGVAGPRVIEQLCAVLRVTAEQLAGDQSLAELGFDSLMAMEARTRIAGATGIDLSILEILGAATAEQLVDVVLGKLDQLSEQVIVLPDEAPAANPVAPAPTGDGRLDWVVDQLSDDDVAALLAELEGRPPVLGTRCGGGAARNPTTNAAQRGAGGMTLTDVGARARLKTLLAQQGVQLYPLSRNQASLWFLYQIDPLTSAYSVGFAGRTSSALDPDRLRAALHALADRHPSLRATFRDLNGRPLQQVRADASPELEEHDASAWDDDELARRVQADYERPLDLTTRPGVRVCLYRKAADDHVLLLVVHHTLLDLWALAIVLSDLGTLYDDPAATLPPPSGDYAQFVRWQHDLLTSDEGARQRDYWREQLAGAEGILNLPTDHPRKPLQTLRGDSVTFTVDPETTTALNALAREERASAYALLLAAYQVLLARYTEQDDVLVGSPVAGRNRAEFDGVVGHFVNMIVLRGRLAGDPPFRAFLRQARDAALGAVEHQDFPFADLVEALSLPRDPSRPALFQACFAFQRAPKLEGLTGFMVRAPGAPPLQLGSLTFDPFPLSQQQGQFDLSLWMAEAEGALHGELKYNGDLFERATAERMAGHLQALLRSIVADPDAPVSKLRLLPDEERRLVVDEWNDTAAAWRTDVCMHHLVEEQVDRTPDAVAVVGDDGRQLTYAGLETQANQLAWRLRECGVGAKGLVAVFLDRSVDVPPAVVGILKAGAGYVPLETHWPKARIETIVNSLPIRAMVTQSHHADDLRSLECPLLEHIVCVDTPIDAPTTRPDNVSTPDDTAYIIFTSGSTGAPKGVEVTHRPAINLIEWVNTTFDVGPKDKLLFVTSLCFDLSVYDVFGGLASGATVRVAGDDEVRDPERLVEVLTKEKITFWDSAPPALGQLVPFLPERLPKSPLRLVFLSGDWIPVRLPDQLRAVFRKAQVVSLGGATEATIWSNWYPIGEVKPEWVSIPYGKPIQNARYYVLDPALNPCPIGVPGDLYIGGPVLASGYVNDPDMTAAKFVPDPFVEGGVMYRTGDRARFWEDGNLEFLGRQDFQVKIRGYRIELGEIETVLALHPAVSECLVMARSDAGPEKYLAAYIVPTTPGQPLTVNELRSFLREKLPDYMVPPSYVFLDRMPVTPNGKVDRKALPAPELRRDQVGGDYVAPRTPTEEAIAAIVARVLGADRVGVTDDFFELGGNSLRAVQVVHGIEEALGARLSVSALLQAPTVADLAETVSGHEAAGGESGGDGAAPVSAVVTLRARAAAPGDGTPPLFLFHPAGGDVAVYRELLDTLPDGPVYAVPSRAAAGTEDEHESVDAMADAYAALVHAVAPEGPYRLAGWSMGGVLAYAVAWRLEAAGAAIESVTLWDSAVPSAAPVMVETAAFRLSNAFGSLAAAFLDLSDDEREAEAAKLLSLPHDRRIPETIAWAKARGAVPAEVPDELMARQVELSRTHDRLLRNYRLPDTPLAAPLTVVWAEASLADGEPVMDWGAGADVTVVPGTTHFTLLAALATPPRR